MAPAPPPLLVIGGGVIGLSAGVRLLEAGLGVELWAREEAERSVSGVAAALWYPYHARPAERVRRWGAASWRRFCELAREEPASGVRLVEGLELGPAVEDLAWTVEGGPTARPARPEELPVGQTRGVAWRLPVIEMPLYLPWLRRRFEELGGIYVRREAESLEAALAGRSVVVNATGLAARELTGDEQLFAIRGQVVSVARSGSGRPCRSNSSDFGGGAPRPRQNRKNCYGTVFERVLVDDRDPTGMTYVVPRSGDVVLGGVAEEGSESLVVDPDQTRGILARCTALEPALAGRRVLDVRVGLRPGRSTVRLEAERRGAQRIVHDYGHGGAGVTLSWGCADEVVELVRDVPKPVP